MTEPLGPAEVLNTSEFASTITSRFPLIKPRDALVFEQEVNKYDPPNGFLMRLAAAHTYIDKGTFSKNLETMKEKANEITGDQESVVVVPDRICSNRWVLSQLIDLGLKKPRYIYDMSINEGEVLPDKTKILILDDMLIGGTQTYEMLEGLPNTEQAIQAFFLHVSQKGRRNVHEMLENNQHVTQNTISIEEIGEPIQRLSDILLSADMNFLNELIRKTTPAGRVIDPLRGSSSAFGMWYTVPDNYPEILTGRTASGDVIDFPPLLRYGSVVPPYKT